MALSPSQVYLYRGHPSSPGPRDYPGVSPNTNLPTTNANLSQLAQGSSAYTKDGRPGTPRYLAPYPIDYHVDPSNLASDGKGPKAPGVVPWDSLQQAGFEPWNSRNEKLRQSMIQATQAGGFG
jgi:hypothetical protein